MNSKELLKQYVNHSSHPRKKGRFYASEVTAIRKGWKLPEDFFRPNEITNNFDGILNGIMKEDFLANILKDKCKCGKDQTKYEIKVNDEIVIVTKPDFEFTNVVWETKAPITYRDFSKIKEGYKDQLECEFRATNKKVFLGYFVEGQIFPILLEYKPSNVRWKNICKKLIEFNNQL